jgi:flagellar basal-body rod protein FlgC
MFAALDISTSGLVAQRANLDIIAGNIAAKDARDPETGEPFRRRVALMASGRSDGGPGIRVDRIVEDQSALPLRWDPEHPFAIRQGENAGYVEESNVNYHTEMVNALVAARAYEANVTVIETAKAMASETLRLIA